MAINANKNVFVSSTVACLLLAMAQANARTDQFDFLSHLHPQKSTSVIVTGPEHVERVLKHSFVFSPTQAQYVLPEMDKVLTNRKGWTRWMSASGAYIVYEHGSTSVSYMSDQVYRQLTWPSGTKLLPTKKGGCVVEYFNLNYKRNEMLSSASARRKKHRE